MDVVRDNHLEVGDLCLFVLISSKSTPLFDLVIFRYGENDGEQIVPTKEETDNEDGDSSDDSSNDSSYIRLFC